LASWQIGRCQLLVFDLVRLLAMYKTVLSVMSIMALLAACSSASPQTDGAIDSTTTVLISVEPVEKAPEQQFIEDMWDRQAAQPGADIA
jgi:hypothetical protein